MNKEIMRRHYEKTLKETLIDILINSREEIEKEKEHRRKEVDYWRIQYSDLQERINEAIEYIDRRDIEWGSEEHNKLLSILKGSDKE